MLSRLAILAAIVGHLLVSGLCSAICAPMRESGSAAMACCAEPASPTPAKGCCPVEPEAPPTCCPTETPEPSSPEPCPTCPMPCCTALPPAIPAPIATFVVNGQLPALALAPLAHPLCWTAPEPNAWAVHESGPPGPRRANERLASLCVWVI